MAEYAESILPQLGEGSGDLGQPRSPGSTIPDPDMEQGPPANSTLISSPLRPEEPDPRQSLQHVLADEPPPKMALIHEKSDKGDKSFTPAHNTATWVHEGARDVTEDEGSIQNDSYTRGAEVNAAHTMTASSSRRTVNGTIGSVYSGNKIRHLKKEDGIPLWRKDIQYAFLRAVFEDQKKVFTKASDGTSGHTFADIYIDAMAKSSKTSKILKDKLLSDRTAAVNMAMVCLLVNVGRMNTTLNFFPEMRAQLRTYHSIPSLQARQDPNAYKQLQDAPRLKSILKGASEDSDQPNTIEKIRSSPLPRTNPVNLIFVLQQYAPKISEIHFYPPRDFFDLVMRSTLSSRSRARAFLWLVWWYLESDFSEDAALHNPFGPGQVGEGTDGLPLKVPPFEHLTEEQATAENLDTEEEIAYGEMKRIERKRILEEDEAVAPPMKRNKKGLSGPIGDSQDMSIERCRTSLIKMDLKHLKTIPKPGWYSRDPITGKTGPHPLAPSRPPPLQQLSPPDFPLNRPTGQPSEDGGTGRYQSDTDRTRSASPMSIPTGIRITNLLNDDDPPTITTTRSRGANGRSARSRTELANSFQRIILKTRVDQVPDLSSPAPPGIGHPVLHPNNPDGVNQRRPRPQTAHQQAVNENRKARVEHILHNKLKEEHAHHRNRRKYGEGYLVKAARRISELPDLYDSEDENSWGPGGLVPNPGEEEDYGEEALYKQKILNRALRRISRWEDGSAEDRTSVKTRSYKDAIADHRVQRLPKRKRSSTPVVEEDAAENEELDDLELELLGESRGRGVGETGKKVSRQAGRGARHEAQDEEMESVGEESGSEEHESEGDEESEGVVEEMDEGDRLPV